MFVKKILKRLFARLSVEVCTFMPLPPTLWAVLKLNEIQLRYEEAKVIFNIILKQRPCNFLVFGLGNDSIFWRRLNRDGNTVFLENDDKWFKQMLKKDKQLKAHLVNYKTQLSQWKELLDSPTLLDMKLPAEVEQLRWDIILVDAPAGYNNLTAGRMKGIYLSHRLVGDVGHVFVHDCDREVEQAYCDRYFNDKNLRDEVLGCLRHYQSVTQISDK